MRTIYILLALGLLTTACHPKKMEKTAIEKSKTHHPKVSPNNYNVAFLIMNGTYNTEFTAPFDIFQHTQFRKGIKAMNTFTVANTLNPITTFEGIRILPDFNYTKDSIPKIDILVVPSAEHHLDTDLKDSLMLDFVRKVDKKALFMTSHCDGAFVLAKAGLLDSVTSTTFPSDIELYRKTFPHLKVEDNVLFVHDGKYITSAGGAKSFEAALYVCEFLYGKEIAASIAKGLVIDWDVTKVPNLILQ
ncbi:DJ-1/PfpI family protein [Maribacter polysiphoniae]|uniref:DJ-1/PfpI family protein n=1 Tax=Maribacter polysiphoniae TaxID=429344 RepID=A0A316EP79_9FLAO|nr:DJ-1/PfpI family protein [Maribacter polysiphoniae]MBD1259241.1 DJ-1/PfpI family protein [Maribacter polysiphoniae]PWK24800.1 DJ-1/PfpI family protein [Maribacter polysiphoniae]